jgi:hypothetical protein
VHLKERFGRCNDDCRLDGLGGLFNIGVLASDRIQCNCRAGGKSGVSVNASIKIRESVYGNEDVIGGVFLPPRDTNGLSSDPSNDVLTIVSNNASHRRGLDVPCD